MHLKIRNRQFGLVPERKPMTLTYPRWPEYEYSQLETDTRTVQETVYNLTMPTPPEDAWKALAAVAARYATAQGVTAKSFIEFVNDEIVASRGGDVPPDIAAIDAVLGTAA